MGMGFSFAHIFVQKSPSISSFSSSQAIVYTDPLQIKLDESTLMCVFWLFRERLGSCFGAWYRKNIKKIHSICMYKDMTFKANDFYVFLRHELPVENILNIWIYICYTSIVYISTLRIFFLWAENKRNRLDTPPNSDRSHTKPLRYQKKKP